MRTWRWLASAGLLVGASGCLIERTSLVAPDAPDAAEAPDAWEPADATEDAFAPDAPHIDAPQCPLPTETRCGDTCVNLLEDDLHCGGCDVACDARSHCAAGSCTCDVEVYGGCEPAVRIWLDAQNTTGTGSPEGALTTWRNLAQTDAGDAELESGSVTTVSGMEGNLAVRFGSGRLRTTGPMAGDTNTHMEIFLVARSRDVGENGFTLATSSAPPNRFSIHLPWNATAFFDFPLDGSADNANGRMSLPFTRSERHITLWHAFQGNDGGEVRVNNTLVLRRNALASPSRDFTQRLLLGGASTFPQDVDMHELLVFDQPLTEASRTRITRALTVRWHLNDTAPLPTENLFLHLDATRPLGTLELPTDGALPQWFDRSDAHRDATTLGSVRWQADGLGEGFPAVRLRPSSTETNETHIRIPRPADAFTAFLVMATEDGRGTRTPMQCPSLLSAELENTDLDGGLLLCGGRPAFFRGNGAGVAGATLSPHRIDDGGRHLLIVRRETSGMTTVTVDHEVVIQGFFAGPISPANWLLGRHEGNNRNGNLSADIGELLVYDTALEDERLNIIERTLRTRWRTPVYSRAPHQPGCERGTRAVCPFTNLSELRTAPGGVHWLRLDGGTPFRVSVDDDEGGGWVLVLQYVRQAGSSAVARVIAPGFDWPLEDDTRLGLAPQRASERWGHIGREVSALLTDATELRWYGTSSGHTRVIHFASHVGVSNWVASSGNFRGIQTGFRELLGHSSALPATADNFRGNGDDALTNFPFFDWGQAHWSTGTDGRWEVDDFHNASNATLHRIWVRASASP